MATDLINEKISKEEFELFVGEKAPRFVRANYKVMNGGKIDWAWMPAFFPLFWSAYYKFWGGIFFFVFTLIIALAITGIPIVIEAFYITSEQSNSEVPRSASGIIYIIAMLLPIILNGLYLKPLYVRYAYRKISELQKYESDKNKRVSLIADAGGTSRLWLAFAMIFAVLFMAMAAPVDEGTVAAGSSLEATQSENVVDSSVAENENPETANIEAELDFTPKDRGNLLETLIMMANYTLTNETCGSDVVGPFMTGMDPGQISSKLRDIEGETRSKFQSCYGVDNSYFQKLSEEAMKSSITTERAMRYSMAVQVAAADSTVLETLVEECQSFLGELNAVHDAIVKEKKLAAKNCEDLRAGR